MLLLTAVVNSKDDGRIDQSRHLPIGNSTLLSRYSRASPGEKGKKGVRKHHELSIHGWTRRVDAGCSEYRSNRSDISIRKKKGFSDETIVIMCRKDVYPCDCALSHLVGNRIAANREILLLPVREKKTTVRRRPSMRNRNETLELLKFIWFVMCQRIMLVSVQPSNPLCVM